MVSGSQRCEQERTLRPSSISSGPDTDDVTHDEQDVQDDDTHDLHEDDEHVRYESHHDDVRRTYL